MGGRGGEGRGTVGSSGDGRRAVVMGQESNAQDKAVPPPSGSRQLRANRARYCHEYVTFPSSSSSSSCCCCCCCCYRPSCPLRASKSQSFLVAPDVLVSYMFTLLNITSVSIITLVLILSLIISLSPSVLGRIFIFWLLFGDFIKLHTLMWGLKYYRL